MSVNITRNAAGVSPGLYDLRHAMSTGTIFGSVSFDNISSQTPHWDGPDWSGSPTLDRNGCIIDESTWNCMKACLDVDRIFSSAYTLQNCIAFPQISSLLTNHSLTEAARATAAEAGIAESSYNSSKAVYDVITGCLDEFCRQHGPDCNPDDLNLQYCYEDAYGQRYCFTDPCQVIDKSATVNADIGGIGVRLQRRHYGS